MEEIDELNNIESHYNEMPFIEKAKFFVCSRLKTHGFIIVLLAASIPNPLFDLAGITCGHFLVPFSTFFGATMIGKALIKVTIQVFKCIISVSFRYCHIFQTPCRIHPELPGVNFTILAWIFIKGVGKAKAPFVAFRE